MFYGPIRHLAAFFFLRFFVEPGDPLWNLTFDFDFSVELVKKADEIRMRSPSDEVSLKVQDSNQLHYYYGDLSLSFCRSIALFSVEDDLCEGYFSVLEIQQLKPPELTITKIKKGEFKQIIPEFHRKVTAFLFYSNSAATS